MSPDSGPKNELEAPEDSMPSGGHCLDQSHETPRWATALILLIAVGAFVLRVQALLRPGGILGAVVDYDEGVYYSAAALLAQGHLPYRDFVLAPAGKCLLPRPDCGHLRRPTRVPSRPRFDVRRGCRQRRASRADRVAAAWSGCWVRRCTYLRHLSRGGQL